MDQLEKLAGRIPNKFLTDNGRNMTAMDHAVATQYLLAIVGPYSLEVLRELRGEIKGKHPAASGVVGAVCRLTCTVDGREVRIEESGGVENAGNIDGDGERLKHAISDAIKRCAMRLGLGLHLWADTQKNKHYFLDASLRKRREAAEGTEPPASARDIPEPAPPGTPTPINDEQGTLEDGRDESGPGRPGSGSVELESKRDHLANLIEARGRDLHRFESMVGAVDEIDEETLDHWISRLEVEGMKGAAAGSPRG